MVRKAKPADCELLTELALRLYLNKAKAELLHEFDSLLADESATVFLWLDDDCAVGFAECQLRYDYVEGTNTSPVGYLEGVFVIESHRHRGIAKKLLKCCEEWAKEKGCTEFASDCELSNTVSFQFHLKSGFSEANRIICFKKVL